MSNARRIDIVHQRNATSPNHPPMRGDSDEEVAHDVCKNSGKTFNMLSFIDCSINKKNKNEANRKVISVGAYAKKVERARANAEGWQKSEMRLH